MLLSVLTFDVHVCLNSYTVNRQNKGFLGMTGLIVKQNFTSDGLNQILKVPFRLPRLIARFACLKPKTCMTADVQ